MEESPRLRFAFEARVEVAPSEHIGNGAGDVLDFTPIIGGTVDGPHLRGTFVPTGGDWALLRGEAASRLDPAISSGLRTVLWSTSSVAALEGSHARGFRARQGG